MGYTFEVSLSEIRARAKLSERTSHDSQTGQIVRRVFVAMYGNALTVERIAAIGSAIFAVEGFTPSLAEGACKRLVRLGVLRSRRQDGETFYEVNF